MEDKLSRQDRPLPQSRATAGPVQTGVKFPPFGAGWRSCSVGPGEATQAASNLHPSPLSEMEPLCTAVVGVYHALLVWFPEASG